MHKRLGPTRPVVALLAAAMPMPAVGAFGALAGGVDPVDLTAVYPGAIVSMEVPLGLLLGREVEFAPASEEPTTTDQE